MVDQQLLADDGLQRAAALVPDVARVRAGVGLAAGGRGQPPARPHGHLRHGPGADHGRKQGSGR